MAISKIITSSLTDDAVTSAKIGTDQVGADALSSSAISGAVDIPANSVGESELSVDYTAQSVPHIIPGVLQPAIGGKLLNGANHSGAYGTAQTQSGGDGHKYYYTDIKGSRPIKDPRIGAYFGSQRHKFKSLQALEQETANHGGTGNVYSVDGRNWIRCVDGSNGWTSRHDAQGTCIEVNRGNLDGTDFMEITGYFNFANISVFTNSDHQNQTSIFLNGTDTTNDLDPETTIAVPHQNRYVDAGSLIPVNLGTVNTPGINTLKLTVSDSDSGNMYALFYAIDLIAQDISTTANRSKIQIPAQNVVSVGKKFAISATADHYDPFSAKTDGSAWTSPTSGTNNANSAASWPTNIDTAHSLGLDKWVDGSSYYRPYNGGRVVKYVDSTGTIKTAVNMMPPNAKSIKDQDINKKTKNAGNITNLPTFELHSTDVHEDQLHEVAKTFHFREFGNGSANANASYRDATILASSGVDINFCMDDGLTALSADDVTRLETPTDALNLASDDRFFITFIGTGISVFGPNWAENATAWNHIAQNLHYGTHVLKIHRVDSTNSIIDLDGVSILGNTGTAPWKNLTEVSFFQPKRPPIPENVVVLADYMLMADFVPIDSQTIGEISKGVREQNPSRDVFYDGSGYGTVGNTSTTANHNGFYHAGHSGTPSSATSNPQRIPSFGTNIVHRGHASPSKAQIYIDSTSQTTTDDSTNNNYGSYQYIATNKDLGVYNWGINATAVQYAGNTTSFEIATPIHTSHHYQSFETPFLHELVGGDRNMEQHNLVCSPDGKTWDEVTRDTSYMGSNVLNMNMADSTGSVTSSSIIIWNKFRGSAFDGGGSGYTTSPIAFYNKNFAIAYDRYICLVDGQYEICVWCVGETGFGGGPVIQVNDSTVAEGHFISGSHGYSGPQVSMQLNRGDEIKFLGALHNNDSYTGCFIRKL